MSPQAGFPTSPTPSAPSISPTFRGFMKWSITFALYGPAVMSESSSLGRLFLVIQVRRGHRPQPLHDGRQRLQREPHLVLRVPLPAAEGDRAGADVAGDPDCPKDGGGDQVLLVVPP